MTAATAGLGAVVSSKALDIWYLALDKPELTPPGYVFSIVWPILFVLMALAAVLVRIKAGSFAACFRRARPLFHAARAEPVLELDVFRVSGSA